jgi:hypothetical protein
MLHFIYTIAKHILLIITIGSIIIHLEYKLELISNNNSIYTNIMYVIGGMLLSGQTYLRLMFSKEQTVVTLERENLEK